jgi:DNA-binding NtrC family response regulator
MDSQKDAPKENKNTILIIDHDSELASILGAYLNAQGFRTLFTTRIREAVRKVANQKFTHIFVDIELKPESATPLLMELSTAGSLNSQTSLTVMSLNLDATVPMAHLKRIYSVLPKPFTLQEFASHVAAVEKKRSQNKTA